MFRRKRRIERMRIYEIPIDKVKEKTFKDRVISLLQNRSTSKAVSWKKQGRRWLKFKGHINMLLFTLLKSGNM